MIEQLDGLSQCQKLRTLYISHNKIKKWEEVEKLSDNPRLEKVTLANNPVYKVPEVIKFKSFENPKISVLSRIPWLKSLDNQAVSKAMVKTASKMVKKEIKAKM